MGRPSKLDVNVGDKFGDLECIGSEMGEGHNYYIMKCTKCGREKKMLSSTIRLGHGISHKACGKGIKLQDPVFYERWQNMRARTQNPNLEHADCYINRGIKSDEFENFIDFYDAMYEGFKELADKIGPNNTSLERKDPNLSYTKENCTWIDKHEQQQNCRKTVDFLVTYPDGHQEIGRCIGKFAREHNLDDSSCYDVMNGRITHHKGYKFKRLIPAITFFD